MKSFFTLVPVLLLALNFSTAEAETQSCLQWVRALEKQKDAVMENGGIWGYFEKNPKLRQHSTKAIQLDNRINKVMEILGYLCETQNGIPLNDLAQYVSRGVAQLGLDDFKSEMNVLGKTSEDIEIWLEYADYAKRNQYRTLDATRIRETIDHAKLKMARYVQLAKEISERNSAAASLEKTGSLTKDLDLFLSSEPYLAQALEENSHIPYWDLDESVGGS